MKFKLKLAPTERIIRDKEVELTLIGTPIEVPGAAAPIQQETFFKWTRDVVVDGEVVDFEQKTGNLHLPYLPAEMLLAPNNFLPQINAIIANDPNMQGMVVVGVEKIGAEDVQPPVGPSNIVE